MENSFGLERLWAGWRSGYVASTVSEEKKECVMCYLYESKDFEKDFIIFKSQRAVVSLNLYPYGSGHLLIFGKSHVASLEDLPEEESHEIWNLTKKAIVVIKSVYKPDGLNLGANIERAGGAGIPGHVHLHLLPRWIGDTNFMTTIAETRVLPESIKDSWTKLSKAWKHLYD